MMKLREQLMTMRRWDTATMMFIFGVQMIELEISEDMGVIVSANLSIYITKYLNNQLDDVDDTLEAVTDDEHHDNDSEDSPNNKVSSLPPTHHTSPSTSCSVNNNLW